MKPFINYNNQNFYPQSNSYPQTFFTYTVSPNPVNGNYVYNYDNNKVLKIADNNITNVYPNYLTDITNNNNHYNNTLNNLIISNNTHIQTGNNYAVSSYNNINNNQIVTQLPVQNIMPKAYKIVQTFPDGKLVNYKIPVNNNIKSMNNKINNTIHNQSPTYLTIPHQLHPLVQEPQPITQHQQSKIIPIRKNLINRAISPTNNQNINLNNNDKLIQNNQREVKDIKTEIKNINQNNNRNIPKYNNNINRIPNNINNNKLVSNINPGINNNNPKNNNTLIPNNKTTVIKMPNDINNNNLISNRNTGINNTKQNQLIPKTGTLPINNNQNNINSENNINNINKNINNNINKQIINQNNNIQKINQNINNININQNKNLNKSVNPKQNIPNNNNIIKGNGLQDNFATVKKIEDGKMNIPVQTPMVKKKISEEDYKNIIYKDVGMINLGNTCFINSCLQVLIHCPLFIHKFFNKYNSINKGETLISRYFFEICNSMVNTINTQEKYIDITNFKTVFGTKHQMFEGYLQNDSQEFCRIFLEDLSTELNEIKNKTLYRELSYSLPRTKTYKDKEYTKHFTEREKSIITEIFYSQIITTFTCKCKFNNFSFQKLLDFPLLLPENVKQVDIINLLKTYCQTEIIDFERECENCHKVEKHQKEIKISSPPEILILSLQRVDPSTQKKNECMVTFPEILDIKEFIDHECGHDSETVYNLFAVINHKGNMDGGHYFSYIKFFKKEDWYLFNDSSVKKLEKKPENFPFAYALFYIKNKYLK